MVIFFRLFIFACFSYAEIEEDLTQVKSFSFIIANILQTVEKASTSNIANHLDTLKDELLKAENSIDRLTESVSRLSENHANFNLTHAVYIRTLVEEINSYIQKLDESLHSLNTQSIKEKIPLAITGLATADTQAKNSVKKIKQESDKLDSTIASNSKFVWVWGILVLIIITSIIILFNIKKAASAMI